ncbi:MAG: ferrous iron transport protein B [Proteobacteria bacterium]|nr:ferrous iron transport protein B [Pseudomonadota bacterium]
MIAHAQLPLIALAGSPNAGKSVLFNALTGLHQKVGNYPGVTVERKTGNSKPWNGKTYTFIDLPGTYSLDPISVDEKIAVDVLTGQLSLDDQSRPQVVVAVVDASNLERTLGLVLELKSLKLPIVVALNMMDLAQRRHLKINVSKLQSRLGLPVVSLIATKGDGVELLLTQIEKTLSQSTLNLASNSVDSQTGNTLERPIQLVGAHSKEMITSRFQDIDNLLKDVVLEASTKDLLTWKIDRIVLHPIAGSILLLGILMVMFQAVFTWAGPLADGIEFALTFLNDQLKVQLPAGFLTDLLTDGVIAGVGSVLVFLPQIILLFFFINILEASGYMTRAAFILDRFMNLCGLQGRSFVPLLSSFACAIPGVMATRSIRSERDRLVTMMVAPLITCSARLPVYTLLISAFVPVTLVWGFVDSRALTMMFLFAISLVSAFAVALVTKFFGDKKHVSTFMLELPSYRMPQWSYIGTAIWLRVKAFLQRAGTIILASSIAIWILSTYPKAPEGATEPGITYSFAGKIGTSLEPLVSPIGFDWRIATSLIPGLAAREVMVSSLATVFAVEASADEEAQAKSLEEKVKLAWPAATGFALIAWYVFAPQCLSTIATVKRETGRWKWALILTGYMFALAWIAAYVTFKIFS